jgi:hypothetical protein
MTPTSLLPKIADHAGLDYPSLCEAILDGATLHAAPAPKRSEERHQSGISFSESDLVMASTSENAKQRRVV